MTHLRNEGWRAILAGRAPLPARVRDIAGGVLWLLLAAVVVAAFVVESVAVGVVFTIIAVLIVIAVKLAAIVRAMDDRRR